MILWTLFIALPIAGLVILLAAPDADLQWEHHPAHFWLVLSVSVVSVALGGLTSEAATRRSDARLFLVSLAFLTSAGFLGLHALATPGVLLENPNAGFVVATPIGLAIAALFAALSSLDFSPTTAAAILRRKRLFRGGLAAVFVGWGAVSLAELPPLDDPLPPDEAEAPEFALGVPGVLLYAVAAYRYRGLLPPPTNLTTPSAPPTPGSRCSGPRRSSRPPSLDARASASSSTPARRSSATSARPSSGASPRSETPPTSPRGSRPTPSRGRS